MYKQRRENADNSRQVWYGILVAIIVCLPLVPAFFGDSREEQAVAKVAEGDALSKTGNFEAAIVFYTEAIELNPKLATAHAGRGAAYAETRRYDESLKDCNEAIWLDPEAAGPYNVRSWIYRTRHMYFEAEADRATADEIYRKERDRVRER